MKFYINKHNNHCVSFKSNINIDNGVKQISQGEQQSEMELFMDNGIPVGIEWDNPIDVTYIGLLFDDKKNLIDYDGVFELPSEAISLIEHVGYKVSDNFKTI